MPHAWVPVTQRVTNSFAQPSTGWMLSQVVQSPRGSCMPTGKQKALLRGKGKVLRLAYCKHRKHLLGSVVLSQGRRAGLPPPTSTSPSLSPLFLTALGQYLQCEDLGYSFIRGRCVRGAAATVWGADSTLAVLASCPCPPAASTGPSV